MAISEVNEYNLSYKYVLEYSVLHVTIQELKRSKQFPIIKAIKIIHAFILLR
jgi:hypothetical protein